MKDSQQIEAITEAIINYLELNRALDLLPQIAQKLTEKSWVKIDPNLALVSAPIKLSASQLKLVQSTLSSQLKRQIRVKAKVDPSIIAGFKINIAGKIIDVTVNRRLKSLKETVIYD
ncbi:MAG: F0F1 ATP synthase subunit delta [Candidatus Beckwithbacteria bacterium]